LCLQKLTRPLNLPMLDVANSISLMRCSSGLMWRQLEPGADLHRVSV
jgi:hypothetical protein